MIRRCNTKSYYYYYYYSLNRKEKLEKNCKIRNLLPSIPSGSLGALPSNCLVIQEGLSFLPSLDDDVRDSRGVLPFKGGEREAMKRINEVSCAVLSLSCIHMLI